MNDKNNNSFYLEKAKQLIMDLTQSKLTKSEWTNVEIKVSENELIILELINHGFEDVNIRINKNLSLFQMMKIEFSEENECYLYKEYFEKEIQEIIKKYKNLNLASFQPTLISSKPPKKSNLIRMKHMNENIMTKKTITFEYTLLDLCKVIIQSFHDKNTKYAFALYTIIQIQKSNILNVNKMVLQFVKQIVDFANKHTSITHIIHHAYDFIEKNQYLLKYEDITLFPHQKQLFSIFKKTDTDFINEFQQQTPKLVLYIAPTGTGKTLSPIGLSNKYRIIFICVARHIGLALAKSAISMNKKIAFAFGCETASDIRLHYFAASTYTRNKQSGGIGKVDNSVGNKVEIMICDVKSYITAMHYMLAFNPEQDIITYWDEPTITMDYPSHELHETIHKNWKENQISKLVLSCATLPNEMEIQDTIMDFKNKFENAEIHTITSYDFKKTISLLNKEGKCVLPHLLYSEYNKLTDCISNCEQNKTLLRYFDLKEIIRYIEYIHETHILDESYQIHHYFSNISDITMNSLKIYYLETLKHVDISKWTQVHCYLKTTQLKKFPNNKKMKKNGGGGITRMNSLQITENRENKITNMHSSPFTKSQSFEQTTNSSIQDNPSLDGILLTTSDAHTLTDGPSIFLIEDVEKFAKLCIQSSNIPTIVFKRIMDKIEENNQIQKQIQKINKSLEDKLAGVEERKEDRKIEFDPEIRKLSTELETLQRNIKSIYLDNIYIPNKESHQEIWTQLPVNNAFIPDIDETIVKELMEIEVDDCMKVLLLMGIGMFNNNPNIKYMEIMKKLAYDQKLFLIIASSDYIYGTNYAFCHGFIGKDLANMTQQKIIQSMGRIGRNNIQQEYTVRFRDDQMIMHLFDNISDSLEAVNMSKLFNSD
jgi:hypothetical protein